MEKVMPTNNPTGYETYIYDHKAYPGSDADYRQHRGPLHDPAKLPSPECDLDTAPFIMIEPCYASGSNDIWLYFRDGKSLMLSRYLAEQLRDALIKICQKPVNRTKETNGGTP